MHKVTIFTDGSSRGNPGRGGWGAILVYPNASGEMKVDELGGRENDTTNNRMELTAAIQALSHFDGYYGSDEFVTYVIHTDSSYLINGSTKWVKGWEQNHWLTANKKQVINQDLWEAISVVTEGKQIEWKYIAGHSGIPTNERCDKIATSFADDAAINLYKGTLASYSIDVTNFSGHLIGKKKSSKDKSRSAMPAYSYVSLVDGKLSYDKTWKECEAKVKGKKGAKYKKVLDAEEEKFITQEFLGK